MRPVARTCSLGQGGPAAPPAKGFAAVPKSAASHWETAETLNYSTPPLQPREAKLATSTFTLGPMVELSATFLM